MTFQTPFNDNTPMPFGKYRGTSMANIPAVYLLWLYNSGCSHTGVRRYIMENMDALNQEAKNVKR